MTADEGFGVVEAMERAVGCGDGAGALRHLTQDVAQAVGARPVLRGVDAVRAAIAEQGRRLRRDGHTPRRTWLRDDALVAEVESGFTRLSDDRAISPPCTDIHRFAGRRIRARRVQADMSPFHEAP